ncbi:MAG TPA: hypothetical protein VFW66_06910 [Gemmatimonadales bacterium]|nr:hypothetical protein [Gemmatimonadales bacterium]
MPADQPPAPSLDRAALAILSAMVSLIVILTAVLLETSIRPAADGGGPGPSAAIAVQR